MSEEVTAAIRVKFDENAKDAAATPTPHPYHGAAASFWWMD
jgi:hypothetical protein